MMREAIPPEVLDAVGAAADRAEALAEAGRELNFRLDDAGGHMIVELRELDGAVLDTLSPSAALDYMTGDGAQA